MRPPTNNAASAAVPPSPTSQTLPWLTATVGRVPNPWFSSDLVWHDDLNFEGAYLGVDPLVGTSSKWRPFGGLGVFPLQDVEQSASVKAQSKMLLGAQLGVEWIPDQKTRAKIGLAYYDFRNISGTVNSFNDTSFNRTAPDFRQKGNTLFNIANDGGASTLYALSADYQLLNLTGVVDLKLFDPAHVIISGDYVKNVGFSQSKTLARTGIDITEPQTTGYMARVAVGMPTMLLKDDWQVSLAYRYLEADAVVDAFTDSSFHLGGTNNKGYILGAQYGLGKNAWMTARWMSSNEIRGLPLSVDVLQLYFNARF